jgi:hypothetical protein
MKQPVQVSVPPPSVVRGVSVPTTVVHARPIPSGRLDHAITVAEGIKATGVGCNVATFESGPQNNTVGNPSKEQVSCSIGEDTIAISLFNDHAKLVSSMSFIRTSRCFVAANQATNTTYVVGDNWIVFPQHAATAKHLADLLHVTTTTIRC